MTHQTANAAADQLVVTAPIPAGCEFIFSEEAMAFAQLIVEQFQGRRDALLAARVEKQAELDKAGTMDFRKDTKAIRDGDWKIAPIPVDLQDRRVEITGPAESKMIINALNSGARVFMADIEDSLSPTFEKVAQAQKALYEAVRHELTFTSAEGKHYTLKPANELAVMIVRPRGWHLPENNITYNGKPVSGSLIDFACGSRFWCCHAPRPGDFRWWHLQSRRAAATACRARWGKQTPALHPLPICFSPQR